MRQQVIVVLPAGWLWMLSVWDAGAGFVAYPRLCRLSVGQGPNVWILHDHARAGVPSQNSVVVSRRSKIHSSFIVIHCFPQRVICGRTSSRSALTNAGTPQTLPKMPA